MTDQVITLRITADGKAAISGIKHVESELEGVGRTGTNSGRKAAQGMRDIEAGADRAGRSLNKAKSLLVGFVGAAALTQAARGVIRMADEYTNLSSKIKLVTDNSQKAAQVQKALFEVAQDTRSGLQSTGDLYVKLARSTRNMGLSQQKLLGITKTINQSFVVSGASASEANAAIIQLGQGLASGALRGDEFNSVAEQAPIIMDLLAEHLGMTRGELRKFAAEGKITAKTVVDSLSGGAKKVQDQYDQMQITIAGAFQKVKNAVAQSIGEASASTGGANALANGINAIAENMDSVINAVVLLGKIAVAVYVGKLLKNGAAWITSLRAQTTATVALGDASAAASAKQVTGIKASITQVGKLRAAGSLLMAAFAGWSIGTYLRDQFVEVRVAGLAFVGALLKGWEHVKYGFQVGIESIVFAFKKSAEVVLRYVSNALADMAVNAASIPGIGDDLSGKLLNMAKALQPTISATGKYKAALAELAREHRANVDAIDDNITDLVSYELAQDGAKKSADSLSKSADAQSKHIKTLANDQGDATKVVEKFAKQLEEANLRLSGLSEDQADYVLTIRDLRDQYDRWITAGVDAADAQKVLNQRVADAVDGFHKAKSGARDYANELPKVAHQTDQLAQIVDRSAQSMADAFAGWMTGTLSKGKSFASQMVDLVKQMVAQMIAQWAKMRVFGPLLQSIFGGSGSGYGSGGYGSVASYASLAAGSGGNGGSLWSSLFGGGTGSGGLLSSIYGAAVDNFGGSGSLFSGQSWMGFGKQLWSGFSDGFSGWTSKIGSLFGAGGTAAGSLAGGYGGTTALLYSGGGTYAGAYGGTTALVSGGYYGGAGAASAYGGASAGASAGAASSVSWIPIIGWIIAAVMANLSFYKQGWRAGDDVNKDLYSGDAFSSGLFLSGLNGPAMIDKTLHALGFNDFLSSLLSGSSGFIRLFGHRKPRATGQGVDVTLGPDGASGSGYVDWKAKGGLFRGDKHGTATQALGSDMLAQFDDFWDSLKKSLASATATLGKDAQTALDSFSVGLKTYAAKGEDDPSKFVVSYLGRTWTEATQEAATQRIGAEGIIRIIDSWLDAGVTQAQEQPDSGNVRSIAGLFESRLRKAVDRMDPDGGGGGPARQPGPSNIAGEASAIAERWRDDAAKLAEGAQFLLGAATDMQRGTALLADTGPGSLTAITDLVTELAQQDEALADTYQRLKAETETYRNLLSLAGVTTNKTGTELVEFADAMASAAGGLQNLQQISQAFTQAFYGQGNQLVAQIDAMRQQVTGQLGALGLDAATSMDQFRTAYEAALPTLSPQDVLQWMQAGLALAQLNQAMDQLAAQQGKYDAFMEGIYRTIGAAFDQPWTRQFAQLDEELHGMINQANALARAAGHAGASEKDLAAIHEYMAQKAAAMIAALKQDTLSLASQLYGGAGGQTLDQLNAQIAALQSSAGHAAGGIKQAAASIDDTASLLIGDLSPYNDRQKLEIAKQQYLSGKASEEDVLRIGQRLMASGADYQQLFDWVMANKRQLAPGAGGFGGGGAGQNNAAQLAELIKQRDALQEQQRFGQAQQLASNIAQMAEVTGDSFADIAAEIQKTNQNFSLSRLAKDLGITDIDAYLTKLQEQDLPGNLGSMTQTLVDTLHELGANLISAILGHPVNPAAIAPITDDGSGAAPIPAGSAPGGTATLSPMPVSLRQDQPLKTDPALLAKVQELSDRTDAQAKMISELLSSIDKNTGDTARSNDALKRQAEDGFDSAAPRSTRNPKLPVY